MDGTAMTCRRAFELDLPGFLADPRASGFADFRDHYPRCAACAAEVRAWTELAARLAGAASAHPEPERLLRFADARGSLPAAERAALEAHLARCAACRDELAALADFEPAALAAPPARGGAGLAGALAGLRRLLWQPALAWAVALLLALPATYTLVRPGARAPEPVLAPAEKLEEQRAQAPAAPPAPRAADAASAEASRPAAATRPAPAAVAKVAREAAPAEPEAPPAPPPVTQAPDELAVAQAPAAEPSAAALDAREPRAEAFAARDGEDAAAALAAEPASPPAQAGGQTVASLHVDAERGAPRALAAAEAAAPPPLRFEPRAGGVAVLRVPVPPDPGDVVVRLVAPDGRSLEQRFARAAGEVELLVAESWLAAGPHRVELHAGETVSVHVVDRP
jgi:hypothetical protein